MPNNSTALAIRAPEAPKPGHSPVAMKRDNRSADYHGRSWSYRFHCSCGKSRRYNTNFLGNRYVLVCDGVKMTRQPKRTV